jgi:hypothetical protein
LRLNGGLILVAIASQEINAAHGKKAQVKAGIAMTRSCRRIPTISAATRKAQCSRASPI